MRTIIIVYQARYCTLRTVDAINTTVGRDAIAKCTFLHDHYISDKLSGGTSNVQ